MEYRRYWCGSPEYPEYNDANNDATLVPDSASRSSSFCTILIQHTYATNQYAAAAILPRANHRQLRRCAGQLFTAHRHCDSNGTARAAADAQTCRLAECESSPVQSSPVQSSGSERRVGSLAYAFFAKSLVGEKLGAMQRCAAAAERTGWPYSGGTCSNSTAVWLHGVRCMLQSSVPRSSVMLRLAEGATRGLVL
jgi:hypothetical protein